MSMSLILGNDNPNADPYAGLTFEYLNYDVDSNGDAWDWETVQRGGPNTVDVFFDSLNGASPATESAGNIVFRVDGGPDNYRCEHTMQEHLNYAHNTWRHWFDTGGKQYAIAYAIEIEVYETGTSTQADITDIADDVIIMQAHDSSESNSPPWALKTEGTTFVISNGLIPSTDTVTGIAAFTRYEIVFGYKQDSAGTDATEVWVDGVKVSDQSDASIFNTATYNHYMKWGIYKVDRKGAGNSFDVLNKVDMSSFGMYSGVDAIAAAKIRVTGAAHV